MQRTKDKRKNKYAKRHQQMGINENEWFNINNTQKNTVF